MAENAVCRLSNHEIMKIIVSCYLNLKCICRKMFLLIYLSGVWATQVIPKGKRFGPFVGEKKKRSQVTSNVYMWEVRHRLLRWPWNTHDYLCYSGRIPTTSPSAYFIEFRNIKKPLLLRCNDKCCCSPVIYVWGDLSSPLLSRSSRAIHVFLERRLCTCVL